MNLRTAESFARSIVKQLVDAGHQALWAGGCVRDQLLGIPPHDYDVATSATPEQVRALFGHRQTLPIGLSFGVVVVLSGDAKVGQVEVATFRTDAQYSDGRRPDSVVYSTAEEDAQRRDFTINGMFYDPLLEKMVDYVGGQADLEAGIIRAIGDPERRIAEDRLRMLRGIRFAARFGFTLSPETWAAIKRNAQHVTLVSGERIADELRKTFQTPHASQALKQLADTQLLPAVLAEFAQHWSENGRFACGLVAEIEEAEGLSKFAAAAWALLHTNPHGLAELLNSLKEHLKFSNKELQTLEFAFKAQTQLAQAPELAWSVTQPLLINPNIATALQVLKARANFARASDDSPATPQLAGAVDWIAAQLQRPPLELDPPPLLNGQDLIGLGLRPGAEFRELLGRLRQMQLDGQLNDSPQAVEWIRQAGQ